MFYLKAGSDKRDQSLLKAVVLGKCAQPFQKGGNPMQKKTTVKKNVAKKTAAKKPVAPKKAVRKAK